MRDTTSVCIVVSRRHVAALLLAMALAPHGLAGGDWPQILGPQRNGVAMTESEIVAWPAAGPARLWSAEVGSGFAGPAVVGNQVILFHRVQDSERIECFDAGLGKSSWRTDFPATYRPSVNPDSGPRCVPLVHGQHIYVFGAAGQLHCVRLADGGAVWSRDAYGDYMGQEGYFGAGATPIVADGKLLVNVGGRDAGVVAFDLATGQTVWQITDERASYSSPTIAPLNNTPHVVFVTRLKCLAIDPRTGQVAFSFPFGLTGTTVNAATPLVFDDHLFVSASYNIGGKLVKLGTPPRDVWQNDEAMSSQYSTCIHHQGHLYGIHGREDFQTGELRCVEALTGKVKWSVPMPLTGSLIRIGGQLLILGSDGELVLASAQPDKYLELARARVSRNPTRSLPALAQGRLYFRDNPASAARLVCLQLVSLKP